MGADGIKVDKVQLVDFENAENNEFLACNQFTVIENNITKRPDVVLFINGLPLVVIELKNPTDENATVQKAFTQLQNYKNAIPSLFYYNAILIASDGLDAKTGTVSSDISRFMAWKSVNGIKEDSATTPQIETLTKGMLNKQVLLDLIWHFIVFEKSKKEDLKTGLFSIVTIKKIAAYHQYFAVNKAIESTRRATAESEMMVRERPENYGLPSVLNQSEGDRKAGVVWHTQGSGKSLSMVFYAGKVVLALNNPTIVVITDRNDLDEQLFDTFAGCKQLLRQDPVKAESRENLKELLKVAGGGIVFSTIQKFFPEDGSANFDLLSERKNIIVIADEAHRSQYDTLALNMRTALPNAAFLAFTGTPL
ncbi:MAG: type I restriction endonuclease, partial [Candidatus Azambacteria bacterium]|nr:type I restriction endonuclease [Candidatus Azambacteria bacterium]